MTPVLVPVDGSENSLRAVRAAAKLIKSGAAMAVHLLNVQPELPVIASRSLGDKFVAAYYEDEGAKALSDAVAVLDHVFELVPVMLHEALHRPRRRVAERADRMPFDLVGDVDQHVEVGLLALPCEDALDHAVHPAGAFAARGALAA